MGLDNIDRKVMNVMYSTYNGGPVGLEAIASTLNEEPDTIADVVEPYLLKAGLMRRTPRGRELTEEAYRHMGFKRKGQAQGEMDQAGVTQGRKSGIMGTKYLHGRSPS